MKLENVSNVINAYVGMHEIFRLLGFAGDVIVMHRNPDGECFAAIEVGDRRFAVTLGHDDREHDRLRDEARSVAIAVNEGRVTHADLLAVTTGVRALLGDREHFLAAIRAKGIVIPNPEGLP